MPPGAKQGVPFSRRDLIMPNNFLGRFGEQLRKYGFCIRCLQPVFDNRCGCPRFGRLRLRAANPLQPLSQNVDAHCLPPYVC